MSPSDLSSDMRLAASRDRNRAIKRGARVRITRTDLGSDWARRRNKNGRITRIDGGYIYVRPMWWKRGRVFELYDNEIEPLDL